MANSEMYWIDAIGAVFPPNTIPIITLLKGLHMANSGIYWIDLVFNFCVRLLIDIATLLGITYEEINVWLFCIIWPATTLLMLVEIIRLRLQSINIKKKI